MLTNHKLILHNPDPVGQCSSWKFKEN